MASIITFREVIFINFLRTIFHALEKKTTLIPHMLNKISNPLTNLCEITFIFEMKYFEFFEKLKKTSKH